MKKYYYRASEKKGRSRPFSSERREKKTKIYYGAETRKATENFPFLQDKQYRVYRFHKEFILALITIKKATARANVTAGNLSKGVGSAIVQACDQLLKAEGPFLRVQFPLPALMGGAGTSIHMNVNEVVANMATEILGKRGKKVNVHPNDHVNFGQSTNDVNPSAIKVAAVPLLKRLNGTVGHLASAFEKRAREYRGVVKLGRTHLQDAVPVTLGEEFAAYASLLRGHQQELKRASGLATILHLGGTAGGTAINASPRYRAAVYRELKRATGHAFRPARNMMAHTGSMSDLVQISQAVTTLTLECSKVATDIRMMSSGPRGGFGEITLPELQKGSSIMPGKVNPIMPETVNILYYIVSGNNLTIEHAAQGANLELAVMVPPVIDRLLQSIKITDNVLRVFADRCIMRLVANKERCLELLERSTAYSTLLTPRLGYEVMSVAVKEAVKTGKTLREVVVGKKLLTNKEFDKVVRAFKP
ncbi:MAG: lyase family protein [Patescibacteria group bacterium]